MADEHQFSEPLRVTLARTLSLAVIAGGIATPWAGGLSRWPILSLAIELIAHAGLHRRGRPSFYNGLG